MLLLDPPSSFEGLTTSRGRPGLFRLFRNNRGIRQDCQLESRRRQRSCLQGQPLEDTSDERGLGWVIQGELQQPRGLPMLQLHQQKFESFIRTERRK
ncbi:hypothetical protein HHI36_018136 [Cryptolaemus montrouzieri]|uniref:Uncharacterized protein n=1 Tax=Cryptolaemus montrouzieri TaxID=559131 RepID=A0ABD2NZ45_9CUCU